MNGTCAKRRGVKHLKSKFPRNTQVLCWITLFGLAKRPPSRYATLAKELCSCPHAPSAHEAIPGS